MTDLTAGQREAYARAHTATVHVWAVELTHPSFPEPLRVVNHKQDLMLALADDSEPVLFNALGFQLREPMINTDPDSTIAIHVDGVSGAVQPYLSAANKTIWPIAATIRPYSVNVRTGIADGPNGTINLQVRDINSTKTTVSLTLGYTNSANKAFPSELYTTASNPSLV